MSSPGRLVYTIGHSNHSMDDFVSLLRRHGIEKVADVRSSPFSRYHSQFNRADLDRSLTAHGIDYEFLGRELGARSEDPSCYIEGRVQYDRIAQTALFREGLERLIGASQSASVAIMCAEKEPLECHRTLLVARALVARGCQVGHILADGRLELHHDSLLRLLSMLGLPRQDLFHTEDDLIGEALVRQETKIAYVLPSSAVGAVEDDW